MSWRPGRQLLGALAIFSMGLVACGSTASTGDAPRTASNDLTSPDAIAAGSAPPFELIEVLEADAADVGRLRFAGNKKDFAQLWDTVGDGRPAPYVDFSRWVAVSISIPASSCERQISEFDVVGDTWTPVFHTTDTACPQPAAPQTFVVLIDREKAHPSFVVHLPGQPTHGFADQDLRSDVPYMDLSGLRSELDGPVVRYVDGARNSRTSGGPVSGSDTESPPERGAVGQAALADSSTAHVPAVFPRSQRASGDRAVWSVSPQS